jgi:hypothetical protein
LAEDLRSSPKLLITKLGAAERQLCAAIRLVFADEDVLAIHTVAAAAYRLLRDIEESRGQHGFLYSIAAGLIGLGEDLAAGKPVPELDPISLRLAEEVAEGISDGQKPTVEQIAARFRRPDARFWKRFSSPANFLKHADMDADAVLSMDEMEQHNSELLSVALISFILLMGRSNPEIEVYTIYTHGMQSDFRSKFWTSDHFQQFGNASPTRRRLLCRRLLKLLRKMDPQVFVHEHLRNGAPAENN